MFRFLHLILALPSFPLLDLLNEKQWPHKCFLQPIFFVFPLAITSAKSGA